MDDNPLEFLGSDPKLSVLEEAVDHVVAAEEPIIDQFILAVWRENEEGRNIGVGDGLGETDVGL